MTLEGIIYQSLFYFTILLGGVLGVSYLIHLFRKQPNDKMLPSEKPKLSYSLANTNTMDIDLYLKKQRERKQLAERQRQIAIAEERKRQYYAEMRRKRYSVVNKEVEKPRKRAELKRTIEIENTPLEFYR
jgi:septum formation topological specificity factor MinE